MGSAQGHHPKKTSPQKGEVEAFPGKARQGNVTQEGCKVGQLSQGARTTFPLRGPRGARLRSPDKSKLPAEPGNEEKSLPVLKGHIARPTNHHVVLQRRGARLPFGRMGLFSQEL